jgi:ATP/maltotriose-dependent transcriptional regulator MalT
VNSGLAAGLQEDWPRVIDAIGRAHAIAGERRAAADAEGLSLVLLGQAQLNLGDSERALGLCRDAVALLRSRGQATELVANVTLARVLLAAQGLAARDEIEAALTRADELMQTNGAAGAEPTIHVERAELARQSGDEAEYERELREAHRLFTQIGATGHAERLAGAVAAFAT